MEATGRAYRRTGKTERNDVRRLTRQRRKSVECVKYERPIFQNVRPIWPNGAGVSASQLGVALARDCGRKKCKIVDALVTVRYEDGDMQSAWSRQKDGKISELVLYTNAEVQRQILVDNGQVVTYE